MQGKNMEINTRKDYTRLAGRTLSDEFFMETVTDKRQLHGAIGLVTETQELLIAILKPKDESVIINIGEEIGDMLWYIAIFEREFDLEFSHEHKLSLSSISPLDKTIELLKSSIEILDMYKKLMFYKRPIDQGKLFSLLSFINDSLNDLCYLYGLNILELEANNINKLYVRFPEKFTTENAVTRDLEKEFEALKGN